MTYSFYVADLADQTIVNEIPFTNFEWTDPLTDYGSWRGTLPLDYTRKNSNGITRVTTGDIFPNRTEVIVVRDDVPLWSGIVTGVRKQQTDELIFDGPGLMGYFDSRYLAETRTYAGIDQLVIAEDLILWAQANGSLTYGNSIGPVGGNIGLTVDSDTSGITREKTYEFFQRKNIGDAFRQLTEADNGFDWFLSYSLSGNTISRELNFTYPARGRDTNIVFDYPGQIDEYTWSVGGSQYANEVFAIGEGEGAFMLLADVADVGELSTFPIWTRVITYKDVENFDLLDAIAREHLNTYGTPPEVYTIQVRGGIGSWVVGDQVTLNINDGYIQTSGEFRITQQKISVDDTGSETIMLTLASADRA